MLASAAAAWENRQTVDGLPLFRAFWDRPAELPAGGGKTAAFADSMVHASHAAERDLSVQVSGWMLMEARPLCGQLLTLGGQLLTRSSDRPPSSIPARWNT